MNLNKKEMELETKEKRGCGAPTSVVNGSGTILKGITEAHSLRKRDQPGIPAQGLQHNSHGIVAALLRRTSRVCKSELAPNETKNIT